MLGLSNPDGVSCYINSVIQVLVHLPFFSENMSKGKGDLLADDFVKLSNRLKESDNTVTAIHPKTFKARLDERFREPVEHDAHDFLLYLLDAFGKVNVGTRFKNNSRNELNLASTASFKSYFGTSKKSIVYHYFYGQYIKRFTCNGCYNYIQVFDPFIDLNLICKESSLSKLIDNHFSTDFVSRNCSECDVLKEHIVSTSIYRPPNILTVTINRNLGQAKKIDSKVIIPRNLDLSKYYHSNKNEACKYKLTSMICHVGTIETGHYFAIIKNDGKWTLFNDHIVKCDIDISSLDPSSPYILFYTK